MDTKTRTPLTTRQQELLKVVDRLQSTTGFAPSMREIAAEMGLASTSSVQWYLHRLQEKGYLDMEPHKSRTIRLKGTPE